TRLQIHPKNFYRKKVARPRKWWHEVQHIMRDSQDSRIKQETAQYLLSRSFAWKVENPRDSEKRTAVLMLAEDVAETLEPALTVKPDSGQVMESEEYRKSLLTALNQPHRSAKGATEAAAQQELPKKDHLPSAMQPAPKKASDVRPADVAPSEKAPSSSLWSITVVLIVVALGLLWLLLKWRSK
ncbi:MAG: hypothetical protein WCS43_16165, partial [Verrucomicrobiota bacterium]